MERRLPFVFLAGVLAALDTPLLFSEPLCSPPLALKALPLCFVTLDCPHLPALLPAQDDPAAHTPGPFVCSCALQIWAESFPISLLSAVTVSWVRRRLAPACQPSCEVTERGLGSSVQRRLVVNLQELKGNQSMH